MTKSFLQWWLFFVLQLIILGASYVYKLHLFILNNDQTYISFILIAIWLVTSMRIGYKLLKHIQSSNEKFWFVAETCMAIGMMGTVLGFILMLGGSNLASIDPTDVEGMKNVIGQLASGMSTALLTTLTGLIVSVSLRTQLMIGEGE
jgi:hypothetical protein|tara:strand:+ start:2903 stop:3343 length:441 start_codon:yes stop_codon:yes gene_type:complete